MVLQTPCRKDILFVKVTYKHGATVSRQNFPGKAGKHQILKLAGTYLSLYLIPTDCGKCITWYSLLGAA